MTQEKVDLVKALDLSRQRIQAFIVEGLKLQTNEIEINEEFSTSINLLKTKFIADYNALLSAELNKINAQILAL